MRGNQMNESAFPNNRFNGMDLRDYFAAKAMQGDWAALNADSSGSMIDAARRYYKMADAMMEARKQASNEIKE
jgi:hypothetical protein